MAYFYDRSLPVREVYQHLRAMAAYAHPWPITHEDLVDFVRFLRPHRMRTRNQPGHILADLERSVGAVSFQRYSVPHSSEPGRLHWLRQGAPTTEQ
jgi:hypothetical protein